MSILVKLKERGLVGLGLVVLPQESCRYIMPSQRSCMICKFIKEAIYVILFDEESHMLGQMLRGNVINDVGVVWVTFPMA